MGTTSVETSLGSPSSNWERDLGVGTEVLESAEVSQVPPKHLCSCDHIYSWTAGKRHISHLSCVTWAMRTLPEVPPNRLKPHCKRLSS